MGQQIERACSGSKYNLFVTGLNTVERVQLSTITKENALRQILYHHCQQKTTAFMSQPPISLTTNEIVTKHELRVTKTECSLASM